MSLRDQLVAKGVVSKKRARDVNRELKQQRKKKQGNRQKKKVVQREQAARAREVADAELESRRAARRQREQAKAERARALQIRQLIDGNLVRSGGPVPFHYRDADRVGRLQVSDGVAWKLRAGELAICRHTAAWGEASDVLVRARAAKRLIELGAEPLVLFYVAEPQGLAAPELALPTVSRDVPDLRARRATLEDIARFRAQSLSSSSR